MVKTSCPLELTFYLTGIRLFWAGGQNRDWEPQGSGPVRLTSL